jgi:hypothetical protein
LVALNDHLKAVTSVTVITVDSIASVPGILSASNRTWSFDTPPVPSAPSDVNLHPCWWWWRRRIFCLDTFNPQVHAPSQVRSVQACDTYSTAIDINVETISCTAVVGVDAVASVPSISVA